MNDLTLELILLHNKINILCRMLPPLLHTKMLDCLNILDNTGERFANVGKLYLASLKWPGHENVP